MNEWKRVKLKDCVKEVNERTTENNQYEVLTSSKSGIYSQEDYFDKQVASKDNVGYKIIKRGQFTYRSMSDNGTFTINRLENKDIGIVSPAYPVFEATDINAEYLKYFFQSERFRKEIYNLSQGSTRTALKYKDLSNIDILLPPIEEQEKIVKTLKKLDFIIEKYRNVLEEKDNFIKSQFVEMFGNLELNDKDFEEKEVSSIADVSSSKRIYANEYQENGVPFYRSKEIIELGHNKKPSIELFISRKRYEEIKEKYGTPNKGDILITAVGTIGETWIVDSDEPFYYKDGNVLQIRLNTNISQVYFKYALDILINIFKSKNVSGSAYSALTIEKFKKMKIILPPIGLQNQFADIVKQIDKQKFEIENSLKEIQELYESLMEKYFG